MRGRSLPAPLLVFLVGAMAMTVGAFAGGCRSQTEETGPVTLLVSKRVIPVGKLVQAAVDDGSIGETQVPRDVAPADPVTNRDEIKCLVPSRTIPQGTVLRRSMFVEPSALGLDRGLTDQTARRTSCD